MNFYYPQGNNHICNIALSQNSPFGENILDNHAECNYHQKTEIPNASPQI